MLSSLLAADTWLLYAINADLRCDLFDTASATLSRGWLLWVLGLGFFAIWATDALRRKAKWPQLRPVLFGILLILATAGVTESVTRVVTKHVDRQQPYYALPGVFYQDTPRDEWYRNAGPESFTPKQGQMDSFYSGHAAHTMAVAVIAASFCPVMSPVIYVMPLAVGAARVYLGKHYPSDVFCGWIVGGAIALLARRLTRNARKRLRAEAKVAEDDET